MYDYLFNYNEHITTGDKDARLNTFYINFREKKNEKIANFLIYRTVQIYII